MSQAALKAQGQTQAAPKVVTVPEWQLAKGRMVRQEYRAVGPSHTVCLVEKFPKLQVWGDGQWAHCALDSWSGSSPWC